MGYKEDLEIDKHALDFEWERQAQLYMKWAEEYADAVLIRDRAKENVDLVRAELYQSIVSKAEKKPTETAIGNEIIQRSEFVKINKEYFEAKKNAEILAGAKEAMQHKKKALEGRTHLWIAGYNAEPKIPAEAKKESFEKTDKDMKLSRKERPDRLKRRKLTE